MGYELRTEGWLSKAEFGEKLRYLMAERGMSQHRLSTVIGSTRCSVVNWANGHTYPDQYHCGKLAEVFGLTEQDLMRVPLTEDQKTYARTKIRRKDIRLKAPKTIASYLRLEMAERRMTVKHLAEIAGVKKNSVYDWTAGRCSPSLPAVNNLIEQLGMPREIFYEIEEGFR